MSDESPNAEEPPTPREDTVTGPSEAEAVRRRLTMFVQPRTKMETSNDRRTILYVGTNPRECTNLQELLDDAGALSRHVHLFVNGRSSKWLPDGMDTKIDGGQTIGV